MEKIVLGGGCFWCIEAVYQMLDGVINVTSGYAGGTDDKPNYYSVSSEKTGHAEVIEVEFDPQVLSLENVFAVFFTAHDPTTRNQQGADKGTQYRSVILYTTAEQKTEAEKFMKKLTEEKVYASPLVTELEPLQKFFPAEDYHQNYYEQNKEVNPYCQVVIDPKIAKIRQSFAHLLKNKG